MPELRRRGEGELPPLHLQRPSRRRRRRLRLLVRQDAGRPHVRARPKSSSSCATRRSARSRASARRPAGRSRRRSCSSTTTTRRTGSSSSISATDSNERDRRAGRLLRPGAARHLPEVRRPRVRARAATTSASTRCRPPRSPTPTCDFKSRKVILQQPVAREQMSKLLETGKTDLLDKLRLDAHAPPVQGASWRGTRRRARSTSSSRRRSSRNRRKPHVHRRGRAAAAAPAAGAQDRRAQDGRGQERRAPRRMPRAPKKPRKAGQA